MGFEKIWGTLRTLAPDFACITKLVKIDSHIHVALVQNTCAYLISRLTHFEMNLYG